MPLSPLSTTTDSIHMAQNKMNSSLCINWFSNMMNFHVLIVVGLSTGSLPTDMASKWPSPTVHT